MLNINAMATVADNEIMINGVLVARLSDDDAQRIIDIIHGLQSGKTTRAKRDYNADPLPPAKDVTLPLTQVKAGRGKIGFYALHGEAQAGAKLMVKAAGFAWDTSFADEKHNGAWVGTTAQAKTLGLTASSKELVVTAEWVQAGRDAAAKRTAKKAAKNA